MNNSFKRRNLKEVEIQLKRADVQKNILIKNIYREYEIYLNIVRKSILPSAEKGIFGIYSDLFMSNESLNKTELINFLNQNISLLINSKLPLLTIEQLNLVHINDTPKQFVNAKTLKELLEIDENQSVDFDYKDELIKKESLEFHCNNNSNSYEYYEILSEDESSSINLDKNGFLNSFPKLNIIKNIKNEKNIVDTVLEIFDETVPNKLNHHENLIDPINEIFISRDNLNFFENIDNAFKHFLLTLSYEINSELFKKNLIKKFVTEDTFKYLSKNKNMIKHLNPFVIKYDLNQDGLSEFINKYSDIYLFNISNIELEFYNFDLSICRSNINELKNRFRLLNKKHLYWKNKEFSSININ